MASEISGRQMQPPVEGVVAFDQIQGDDGEDTRLLKDMAGMADRYLRTFPWCQEVRKGYFALGVGGIIAVFLFDMVTVLRGKASDEWLWVIVGDVPAAYMPLGRAGTAYLALKTYVEGLSEWVRAAERGDTPTNLPIECSRTPKAIAMLRDRIDTLTKLVLPDLAGT